MMVTGYTKWQEIQRRAIGLDKRPNRDVYKRKKMDATQTALRHLRFIVRFAEADLEKLGPKDWSNLRDEVAAFTSVDRFQKVDQTLSGVQGFDRRSGKPLEETEKSIAALQSEVKKILHAVVDTRDLITGRRTGASDEHSGVPIPVLSISADYYLRPANPPFVDRNEVCLWGSERDIFLFAILDLFASEPTNRLNRCPECQRIFVRVRKQLYCSRKCTNRVNARSWRHTPEGKKKNRERAAAQYRKKVRRKWPNAPISRPKKHVAGKSFIS